LQFIIVPNANVAGQVSDAELGTVVALKLIHFIESKVQEGREREISLYAGAFN